MAIGHKKARKRNGKPKYATKPQKNCHKISNRQQTFQKVLG